AGDGGVYAKEATKESLAEALGTLITSEVLRTEKGEVNHTRAKMFSWESSAEKLEKIYQEIL
ncbi:MAG TPA: glycosyltransferase family 1 protein, partial [Candidatus Moranbacteria bacterium]|nr:glycosyltransferase family 1 protein [Candidatus Moranbacteria bacterium]